MAWLRLSAGEDRPSSRAVCSLAQQLHGAHCDAAPSQRLIAIRDTFGHLMIVAFLPGFARSAQMLEHWTKLLPADVRVFDLPGHAEEPAARVLTLEGLADQYMDRIPQGALIVGESLGGLISLAMAPRGYHAVAFDPPLSTAKQWVIHQNVPPLVTRNPSAKWLPGFAAAFLGVMPNGEVEERNYWPVLDALTSPPLWPRRSTETAPSVIDDIDAYNLERHPQVRFRRIAGQHTLLSDSVDEVRAVLLEILEGVPA
jgi:pimeloyl-ACP methyl ester carboxylesterase